jgi:hypothetical protein
MQPRLKGVLPNSEMGDIPLRFTRQSCQNRKSRSGEASIQLGFQQDEMTEDLVSQCFSV